MGKLNRKENLHVSIYLNLKEKHTDFALIWRIINWKCCLAYSGLKILKNMFTKLYMKPNCKYLNM